MKNENEGVGYFVVDYTTENVNELKKQLESNLQISAPEAIKVSRIGYCATGDIEPSTLKNKNLENALQNIKKEMLTNERVNEHLREVNKKLTDENTQLKNRISKFKNSIESHAYLGLVLKSLLHDIHCGLIDLEDVEEVLRKTKHLFQ